MQCSLVKSSLVKVSWNVMQTMQWHEIEHICVSMYLWCTSSGTCAYFCKSECIYAKFLHIVSDCEFSWVWSPISPWWHLGSHPSDHCYWERGFPNVHMKTFTHSPFFGHKVGYLLLGRAFFTAGNQNHLRSLAVLLVKQVNKKQRSLVSSCLGGIGIVVENLHVKKN